MAERENVELVQKAYAAFGRGDVPALLQMLSEDVDWEGVYGAAGKVPMGGRRRGREEVRQFFASLDEHVVFDRFEPREFVAQGDHVIALGSYASRVKANGNAIQLDWAMHFRVRNGAISFFREYTDSATLIAAF
jgi:ketosteroid isomerase-like protein